MSNLLNRYEAKSLSQQNYALAVRPKNLNNIMYKTKNMVGNNFTIKIVKMLNKLQNFNIYNWIFSPSSIAFHKRSFIPRPVSHHQG